MAPLGPLTTNRLTVRLDSERAARLEYWATENPLKIKSYNQLIQEAVAMEVAIKDGSLHSFAGPIYNQAGELVVPAGQNADDGMLAGMGFYVQGIDDELPQ